MGTQVEMGIVIRVRMVASVCIFRSYNPSQSIEATLITHTDGTRSVQYGRQELAIAHGVATYHYIQLSEKTVKQIVEAHTEEVQGILKML